MTSRQQCPLCDITPEGRSKFCPIHTKAVLREYFKTYYQRNKTKIRFRQQQYQKTHLAELNAYMKIRRQRDWFHFMIRYCILDDLMIHLNQNTIRLLKLIPRCEQL